MGARLRGVQQLFVLFHSPGSAWDPSRGFMEQPGIEQHIAFMRGLTERGLMVLGGPFADGDAAGAVGMAVITAPDLAEAERLAMEHRSVQDALIRVQVRPWNVPMGVALESVRPIDAG